MQRLPKQLSLMSTSVVVMPSEQPFKKLAPAQVTSLPFDKAKVVLIAQIYEQWSYVGKKKNQRWLWYAWEPRQSSSAPIRRHKKAQSIERQNLILRTRWKRLARRTICSSKSEDLHDKVIGGSTSREHYQLF